MLIHSDTSNVSAVCKPLVSPNRVLPDLLDLPDPPDLPAVDSTSSASPFRRRHLIPSVAATTVLTTPA